MSAKPVTVVESGRCHSCGARLLTGARAMFDLRTKALTCRSCARLDAAAGSCGRSPEAETR